MNILSISSILAVVALSLSLIILVSTITTMTMTTVYAQQRSTEPSDETVKLSIRGVIAAQEYSEAGKEAEKIFNTCTTLSKAAIYDYLPECVSFMEETRDNAVALIEKYENLTTQMLY